MTLAPLLALCLAVHAAPEPRPVIAGPVMPPEPWRELLRGTVANARCAPGLCALTLDGRLGHGGGDRAYVTLRGSNDDGHFFPETAQLYVERPGVGVGRARSGDRLSVPEAVRLSFDALTAELREARLEKPRVCDPAAECRGFRVERFLVLDGPRERRVEVAVDLVELDAAAAAPLLSEALVLWAARAKR